MSRPGVDTASVKMLAISIFRTPYASHPWVTKPRAMGAGAASLPDNVFQTLRSLGAPEECWAIGGRFDGSEVELHKALHESGDGFLLSCIQGKLSFVKTEMKSSFRSENRVVLPG